MRASYLGMHLHFCINNLLNRLRHADSFLLLHSFTTRFLSAYIYIYIYILPSVLMYDDMKTTICLCVFQ